MKIAVLGSTGMLGQMMMKVLAENEEFEVFPTARSKAIGHYFLDANSASQTREFLNEYEFDYVVNCIGVIKPHIKEYESASVLNSVQINTIFPHILAESAGESGAKVIQIATDCVFSGLDTLAYSENSKHDPVDVYGKTKSLGEVNASNFLNLRASIVGPEINSRHSLLEWFLNHPKGANLKGFINHAWNGVTTLHFAKCIRGIINNDLFMPGTFHLVPEDELNKFQLLNLFALNFDRRDLTILPIESDSNVSRVLSTLHSEFNEIVWKSAGYSSLPSIEKLVRELSDWPSK